MNTITKLIKLETSCDNGGIKEVCFHSLGAVLAITGFCNICTSYQPDVDFSISHTRVCTKTKDCPKPTHFFVDTRPLGKGLLMGETNDNNGVRVNEPTLVVNSSFTLMN